MTPTPNPPSPVPNAPTPNGPNGRRVDGRFAKGNPGGPGNPNARRVARLREAMLKAATPEKLKKVLNRLIEKAIEGDVAAAKEVFERTVGKPLADDILQRIENLEKLAKHASKSTENN